MKKKKRIMDHYCYEAIYSKNYIITEDISSKHANQILNKSKTIIKSLPGYGNAELKKNDIKPSVTEKVFIKL